MLLIAFGGYSQTLNEHIGLNVTFNSTNSWFNADEVSDNFREFNAWRNATYGSNVTIPFNSAYPNSWPTKGIANFPGNESYIYDFGNYNNMYTQLSSGTNMIFPTFTTMHQYITTNLIHDNGSNSYIAENVWDNKAKKRKPVPHVDNNGILELVNGESYTNANSYRFFSEYLSYFGIKYGLNSQNVDKANLYVTNWTDLGKNQASYLEILNEPDAWWTWSAKEGYFSPEEAAYCTSAAYDGHLNTIKTDIYDDYGNLIKHDFDCGFSKHSDFSLLTPGIHEMNINYVQKYLTELNNIRGVNNPIEFDVINFHHYSAYKLSELAIHNTPNSIVTASLTPTYEQNSDGIWIDNVDMDATITGTDERKIWIHPELDGYKLRGEQLRTGLNNIGVPSNTEIWVTEWGYPSAIYGTDAFYAGTISPENAQARWLMRGFMEYQASGEINKSFWHWYQDGITTDWDNNCGIVNNDESKKTSWYHLKTLKEQIGDKTFDGQCYIDGDQTSEEHFAWSYNISNGNVTPILPTADNGEAEEDIVSHPRVYRYLGDIPYADEVWAAWIPTGGEYQHHKRMYLKDLYENFDESFIYNPTQYYTVSPLEISGGYQNAAANEGIHSVMVDANGDSYITPVISDKPVFIHFMYCTTVNPTNVTYVNTNANNHGSTTINWSSTSPPPSDHLGVITVKEGVHLIISPNVVANFVSGGKLIIERGAKVTLYGTLTSCNQWEGVRVEGTSSYQKLDENQEFYTYQGCFKSQNGVIENAVVGIKTFANSFLFNLGADGAVVQCDNTFFKNNNTGADFSLYEYQDNISYFHDCNFIMNDNNPFSTLHNHLSFQYVYGIDITNCKFKNLKANPSAYCTGIESKSSNFIVTGSQTIFEGLSRGISTSFYLRSAPFTVKNATFEKCAVGIANNGVSGATIQDNTFIFGEMPSAYYGTIVDGEKTQIGVHEQSLIAGLGLSGNEFFNTKLNSDYEMTGIYINDIGDFSNQIKGNDFKDLTVGLSAIHWNATYQPLVIDNNPPIDQGLLLLCNTNSPSNYNKLFDFYSVSADNAPIEALRHTHGIPMANKKYKSVGNTFSFRNWPDAHDFSNFSANNIKYYKFSIPETPLNYGGIDLKNASFATNCGGNRPTFPRNPIAEFDQMQQLMDNTQQAYADAFAINDLNAMEEAQNTIVYLQEQLDFIAYDGYIQAIEAFDMDEARFWMQKFNSLTGDLLLVSDYMRTEEYTEAQNLLDQIETSYNFSPERLADFQNVKYIYEQLMINPVDQLPQDVIDNLRVWADSKHGQACYLSRNIFGILGNPYPPVVLDYDFPVPEQDPPANQRLKNSNNELSDRSTQVLIFPNPTDADFEIQISNKSWDGATIIHLLDITGLEVGTYQLKPEQNRIQIHTNLPSGIYFCQIKGDGQVQLNQKIIINK